jgi:hypothetical protein
VALGGARKGQEGLEEDRRGNVGLGRAGQGGNRR